MRTVISSKSLLPLQCPVSFYVRYWAFSIFQSTAWARNPQKRTNQKGGRGNRFATRAKAKGQSRLVPPGGFLRGEQFERERVVPPLSRLLCLLSCRSKKVRPCWQALAESRLENRLKGYNRVTMTTSKYRPIPNHRLSARWLPQSPTVTAPSGRELWGLYLATLVCCFCGSAYCNPSVTPPACQLPLTREPFFLPYLRKGPGACTGAFGLIMGWCRWR